MKKEKSKNPFWDRIDSLFEQALELPGDKRKSFLEEACEGDEVIFNEVYSLIQAFDIRGPLDAMEEQLMSPLHSLMQKDAGTEHRIGPYTVLRLIGYGGMGNVYLAKRADVDYEQRVALKVLRTTGPATAMKKQFVKERQILAQLEHPNIARFLDAGTSEPTLNEPFEQPYLVMEYVKGLSISEYCDLHQLSIPDRLHLFMLVCKAVHFAHQRLIIHRDLKPSNILVTDDGYVKLLDFGIAKLLESNDAHHVTTEQLAFTPEYAAPEQASGETVTTATDVYSLGVVLYQILTGDRPYQFDVRTPIEFQRVICEVDPARPSSAVQQVRHHRSPGGETRSLTPEQVSADRNCTPAQLTKRLTGDLDVVVLKALDKDPVRRYSSALALQEDIQRYLVGQPVLAREASIGYRARKFVSRHRNIVAAMVLLFITLFAGLAGTMWQAKRATDQLLIAEAEAEKARQISTLMTSIFEQTDPALALGDTLTAFDLLEEGTRRIEHELSDQVELQAPLLGVIGRAHFNMGNYEPAERLFEKVLVLTDPSDIENRVVALTDMGRLIRTLSNQEKADSLFRQALSLRDLLPSDRQDLVADVLAEIAAGYANLGQWDSTAYYREQVLEIRKAHFGARSKEVATTLATLAETAAYKRDIALADSLNLAALEMQREFLGNDHPDVASTLYSLATNAFQLREYKRTISYLEEAARIFKSVYGDIHPKVANTGVFLVFVYHHNGQYAQSDSTFKYVMDVQHELYGGDHLNISHALHNQAVLNSERGNAEDAERLMQDAFAMRVRLYGLEHNYTFHSYRGFGHIYINTEMYDKGEAVFEKALVLGEKLFGVENDRMANLMVEYGRLIRLKGEPERSLIYTNRSMEIASKIHEKNNPLMIAAREQHGLALMALGRYEESEAHLLDSLSFYRSSAPESVKISEIAAYLVELYRAWGNVEKMSELEALVGS